MINIKKLKVIFIDLDQTLLVGKVGEEWMGESWLLLTNSLGASKDEHIKIYGDYRRAISEHGDPDQKSYNTMVKGIINLWQEASNKQLITKKVIEDTCKTFIAQIHEEAFKAVKGFIKQGILPIVSTGGLAIVAQIVAEAIGSQNIVKNTALSTVKMSLGNSEFIYDEKDLLTGFKHSHNVAQVKQRQVEEKIEEISRVLSIKNIPTIAISDGPSDKLVFEKTMAGITFNSTNDELIKHSIAQTTTWKEVSEIALDHFKKMEL